MATCCAPSVFHERLTHLLQRVVEPYALTTPSVADTGHSHLPWWALLIAILIAAVFLPVLSVFYAITGWQVGLTTLAQMLGAAVVPGNPQANMVRSLSLRHSLARLFAGSPAASDLTPLRVQYFALYSSSSVTQGINMAVDLKLAQCVSPSRAASGRANLT